MPGVTLGTGYLLWCPCSFRGRWERWKRSCTNVTGWPHPVKLGLWKVTSVHGGGQEKCRYEEGKTESSMPVLDRNAILRLAICLTLTASVKAQQYSFRYYGTEDGLTNLAVKVLFQDRRGFLWAGTESGLFRYDSEQFQRYGAAEGLPREVVLSLGEAPDGGVLAGYRGGLYHQQGERFEKVPLPEGGGIDSYSAIQLDSQGRTFIGTDRGLVVATRPAQGNGLVLRLLPNPADAVGSGAHGVFLEGSVVWYGCGNKLCRMTGEQVSVLGEADGLPPGRWMSIRRDGQGDLWLHDLTKFARMRNGSSRFDTPSIPFPQTAGGAQLEVDAGGRLLVPTIEGLTISEGQRFRTVGKRQNLQAPVYAVLEDREGSIWLGLAGRGLARWRGYREWEGFNSDGGLGSDLVYAILPQGNDTLLIGTEDGLFVGRRTGDRWSWARHPKVGRMPVHALQRENDGSIWLGTERNGAARIDSRTGKIQWFGQSQGLAGASPFALALDRSHRVWAATESGLFVAQLPEKRFSRVEDVPSVRCWAVTEGAAGEILVGTSAGLFILSRGSWRHISTADGLRHNVLLSVASAKPGEIWVGYWFSGNITRIGMDGEHLSMIHYGSEFGLRGEMSYFLGFDARGQLWAGTDQGVKVWDGKRWTQYDHNDGLIWDDCDLQGFAAGPNGSVWIGTSGGLAHFTPGPLTRPVRSPSVIFTRLTLGKTQVEKDTYVSSGYDSNALTVRYSALLFARERSLLFRYRLLPFFSDWQETSDTELQFPGLPPNDYRLEVEARDGQGEWTQHPTVFAFDIRVPWWRTWWFIGLLALLPPALAIVISRQWQLRQQKIRRELERIVSERTAELEVARKRAELLATTDPLTGIYNRRGLLELAERDLQLARRKGRPFSVIIFDLDHFKRINDACGHAEGDRVLREVASVAKNTIRGTDLLGRVGGEEFMVVMPDTLGDDAFRVADRIRAVLSASVSTGESPKPVTASFGVAGSRLGAETLDCLQSYADKALYRAKNNGRNRVEIENCVPPGTLSMALEFIPYLQPDPHEKT